MHKYEVEYLLFNDLAKLGGVNVSDHRRFEKPEDNNLKYIL